MRATFHNAPMLQHENQVGILDRRNAVGDCDNRLLLVQIAQVPLNLCFRFHIDGAGRIVHNQNRRIVGESTRQAQSLLLSAGQADATFADDGIVAVRHAADEAIRAGNGGHAAHVLFVVTTSSALAVVLTVVLKSVASVARAKA